MELKGTPLINSTYISPSLALSSTGFVKQTAPARSSSNGGLKTAATYSPTCAVPSAWRGLTSLFGMGRGGSPALLPPCLSLFPAGPVPAPLYRGKEPHTLLTPAENPGPELSRSVSRGPAAFPAPSSAYPFSSPLRPSSLPGGTAALSESFRVISRARLWRRRLYTCALSTSSSLTTLAEILSWGGLRA